MNSIERFCVHIHLRSSLQLHPYLVLYHVRMVAVWSLDEVFPPDFGSRALIHIPSHFRTTSSCLYDFSRYSEYVVLSHKSIVQEATIQPLKSTGTMTAIILFSTHPSQRDAGSSNYPELVLLLTSSRIYMFFTHTALQSASSSWMQRL